MTNSTSNPFGSYSSRASPPGSGPPRSSARKAVLSLVGCCNDVSTDLHIAFFIIQRLECVIQSVSEDQMDSKADLAIKFPDRKVFGEFCITLKNDDVPFRVAGFQVVVLSGKHYKNLPSRSRQFIETH